MAPKFLGCNRGTISIKRIIWTEPGNWTHWEKLQARSSGTSYLSNTALAQTHRSSSMASSWLNFFERKKKHEKQKTRKNWASYVTLSWRTNVKAKKRIHNMYWPGWWRHTELAQGHVAGSIFSRFFFFVFCFVQKNWASYEALSQQRGIEPATWHWASNEGMVNLYCTGPMDFPMQPLQFQQIKLLINSGTIWDKIEDWQSIHILRIV